MTYPKDRFDPSWVTGSTSIDDSVVLWSESFGMHLAPNDRNDRQAMSTSQIRKFFGEIKRIQASFDKYGKNVPLLKAKLAYAVGRNRNSRIKDFYDEISKGIAVVKGDPENFDRLVSIVESVVAFHKLHGGQD